ncbi:hypothetical protein BDA99DRAFT_512264 [Phascolomyces articulosus]|uniref:Uncharacterized protein n=1 Tax=Phascolomyces articulosus TaxID=60185 RepID=A0AAD5JYE3_9FUNG|nr:hypothetical protein BDA99DRAFT_512264 [Phascolomyces articulosus]
MFDHQGINQPIYRWIYLSNNHFINNMMVQDDEIDILKVVLLESFIFYIYIQKENVSQHRV